MNFTGTFKIVSICFQFDIYIGITIYYLKITYSYYPIGQLNLLNLKEPKNKQNKKSQCKNNYIKNPKNSSKILI